MILFLLSPPLLRFSSDGRSEFAVLMGRYFAEAAGRAPLSSLGAREGDKS